MKKGIDRKVLNTISSIVLLVLIVGGFFWLWNQTLFQPNVGDVDDVYKTVEIESIKNKADSILEPATKDNLSSMPITTPTADLLSRENPFAGL